MSLVPFNGADPTAVLEAIYQDLLPEDVVSIQFQRAVPSALSYRDHWLRLQGILSHPTVYAAFGISSLPGAADFAHAKGLEVIGTLANLLSRGGIHARFVEDAGAALSLARQYLDVFFQRDYTGAEAYSSDCGWCDWFIGEGILDETALIGNGYEWWLLAVRGTD
jgi:hypothetical protein